METQKQEHSDTTVSNPADRDQRDLAILRNTSKSSLQTQLGWTTGLQEYLAHELPGLRGEKRSAAVRQMAEQKRVIRLIEQLLYPDEIEN